MRPAITAILAAVLLAVAVTPIASASPPEDVTIHSLMLAQEEGPNLGTFEAAGSDLICAEGTVTDLGYIFSRSDHSGRNLQLVVVKEFGCPDGTFLVLMRVHVDFLTGSEVFSWTILDGTGAYTDLHGQGTGTTTFPADGQFDNSYTGQLHD